MRLLTGPAGSGKTASILDQLRDALRAGNHSVRLLVPTATMAQHLQNQLAREGFVFPRAIVQTLNAFIASYAADAPQVPETALHLIVEAAARRLNRPEFARVVHMPGFSASLARTISEFSSAGCDSARLAAHLPDAPLSAAFLAVYREVDSELARRGLAMRARRLEIAAQRIADAGPQGIGAVWLDGFHALPDPELHVIAALGRHTQLTLTLNDADATSHLRSRLENMGFAAQRATRPRAYPALAVVKAASVEREAEEIARRILDQAAAGRPFREIGIVVRAADSYVPILRSTLERFGIPARFYFDSKLDEHTAVRFLTGAVDAMLGGWDHAETLAVLRLAPRLADIKEMDRFDFAVREHIPAAGLAGLKSLAGENAPLLRLIEGLASLEGGTDDRLLSSVMLPADWVPRFESLRNLFSPARPEHPPNSDPSRDNPSRDDPSRDDPSRDNPSRDREGAVFSQHQQALIYRSQSAALEAFRQAIDETAAALDPQIKLPLEDFWRHAKAALRLTPLRVRDGRRNAVQVIGAHEARQWSLPVVFVCGMVEKQFPQFHRADPFFPDAARSHLNAAGIRVRTAADFEREERALFDAAITRATLLTTLTYPEFDSRGDRTLPSIFLDDLHLPPVDAPAVRPEPRWQLSPRPRVTRIAAETSSALLEYLRARTARLTPSGLESYLQCAFQYFGNRLLRLKAAPDLPEDRLSFLEQGNLVHEVLAAGYAHPETFEQLFEEAFERKRQQLTIPNGYHTERLRNAMCEDLLAFARNTEWPRAEFQSLTEQPFAFELFAPAQPVAQAELVAQALGLRPTADELPSNDAVEISGRIDRIDTAADGRAYVIDYKYSAAPNIKGRLKDENLLQAPLYMMAAERTFGVNPDGMFYVGLKGGIQYEGWSRSGMLNSLPLPDNWLEIAERRTLQAMHEIRSGRVEVAPAKPANCRFCDCRDICRVNLTVVAEAVAEAVAEVAAELATEVAAEATEGA
jgi:ATP-dependent helicase/DNAse subunit B